MLAPLGLQEPQRDVGDLFLHQVGDDSLELGFHLTRAGDDVDGAEERVCNQAEFVDVPVGRPKPRQSHWKSPTHASIDARNT